MTKPTAEHSSGVIEDFLKRFKQVGISAVTLMDKEEQAEVVNWAQTMVKQYGSVFEEPFAQIKNLSDLPCPKDDLKIAIKALLPAYIAKGSTDIVNLLKDRYVGLSAFQEIKTDETDIIVNGSEEPDAGSDTTDAVRFQAYHKYVDVMASEQKALLEEIDAFMNDLRMVLQSS